MAKGYKKNQINVASNADVDETIYTTSKGIKLRINGLTQELLDTARQSAEYPICPTYKVVTEAGKEEEFDLTETTLEDTINPEATKFNIARWDKYKKESAEADVRYRDIMTKTLLMLGMEVIDAEEQMAKWEKLQRFIGFKIPEDEYERLFVWLKTVVLNTPEELFTVIDQIMMVTGVPEAKRAEARKSFRSALDQARQTSQRVAAEAREVAA